MPLIAGKTLIVAISPIRLIRPEKYAYGEVLQMKILVDARTLGTKNFTGVQHYTENIIRALKAEGAVFDLASPAMHGICFSKLWEQTALPVRACGYDILFCPANIAPLWKPKGTKIVTVFQGFPFYDFPAAYSRSFRFYYTRVIPFVARVSDKIITISGSERQKLVSRFPEYSEKIRVVPNGLNPEFAGVTAASDSEKENYILYVGSMNPVKNLAGALKAFGKIADKTAADFHVVGTGSGIFGKSTEAAEILKTIPAGRVKFLGHAGTKELISYYRKAACLVFPSFYESFGYPPLEAMACGCPVVASEIPALSELCGGAAVYCRPGDFEDIAKKIMLVINDKNLSQKMIITGLEMAQKYPLYETAKKTLEVFAEALK